MTAAPHPSYCLQGVLLLLDRLKKIGGTPCQRLLKTLRVDMRTSLGTIITPQQTLARTAARKVSVYIPHTGMDGMPPAPSIGVAYNAPIRWLNIRTAPVTNRDRGLSLPKTSSGNRTGLYPVRIPCSCVQLPCSFTKIPCSG